MEDKNNNNDFEQFLRSSIEDFKMIPSRKIWYGIYNNMHPDRKWPSIAVCLIILTAVMFVGVANNNSISSSTRKNTAENLLATSITIPAEQNKLSNIIKPQIIVAALANNEPDVENIASKASSNIEYSNHFSNSHNNTQNSTQLTTSTNNITSFNDETAIVAVNNFITEKNINQASEDASTISLNEEIKNIQQADAKMVIRISNTVASDIDNNFEKNTIAKLNENDTKKSLLKSSTNTAEEKLISEVNISNNKPHLKKLKENGSMAYYLTPSFGYRNITSKLKNPKSSVGLNSFGSSNIGGAVQETMKDAIALNLEVGAVFQYKVSKNIRFKTGLQANYTNYISNVTELNHPTQTTLAVTTTGQSNNYRASSYATREGGTHLNKTNWQIAIPIGVDIKIAGNDKLKWYVGATAQPTYILGGNAFVLSADEKYYIAENALIHKWNLNTAIETFVSFKPSANVTLNIGPQFRYQVFSSYKKAYNYSEKLYNVGVKVGLITNF
jgi:hypothetical protein